MRDIIDAMLNTIDRHRLEILTEMALEGGTEDEAEPDEDTGPVREDSRKRVLAMLASRAVRGGDL
jgi:hypothetical protein